MSPFEVVQAIQSASVVGLDSRRAIIVLRSVDDQDVGETAVIRFRCLSQRIEKFGGSNEGRKDFSIVDFKGNEDKSLRSHC
jgi:hypothetical protein